MKLKKLGESKLNSIKSLISTAFNDGQISDQEFKTVLDEQNKYNELKDKIHTKQVGLSEQEKKEINRRRKTTGTKCHSKKKDKIPIMLFNKFVFVNDPPPKYQITDN